MTDTSISSLAERAQDLLALHVPGSPVVLPTVWDVWSAHAVVGSGFPALTVGSHPLADSRGQSDGESMTLTEALEGISRITQAVDVPVSADLESGYDTAPAELVQRALEAGVVGINIEDTVHSAGRIREPQEHADYIAGIRQSADEAGVHLVINGRTDVFTAPEKWEDPLAETLNRLRLLEQAGADSLYPVKLPNTATLETILKEISTPLNVTAHPVDGAVPDGLDLSTLAQLGVARVTFGPLLQAALGEQITQLVSPWAAAKA